MKIEDVFGNFESIEKRLVLPIGITTIWFFILRWTGAIDKSAFQIGAFRNSDQFKQLRVLVDWLGLDLKPWHILVIGVIAFVVIFNKLVKFTWWVVPWKIRGTHADFWRANKSWSEVLRIRKQLEITGPLILSEIENHLRLSDAELIEKHKDSTKKYADERRRRWYSLYSALSMTVLITGTATLVTFVVHSGIFQPRGLLLTLLLLVGLLIAARLRCEWVDEREAQERAARVIWALDKAEGQLGFKTEFGEPEIKLFRELTEAPPPGFPYGKSWLLHLFRQLPLLSNVGYYPWRSNSVLLEKVPGASEYERSIRHIFRHVHPRGALQWTVARLLSWLVRLGCVRNGGPIVGAEVKFEYIFQARHVKS